MENRTHVGINVRRLCKIAGITQSELANRMGIKQSTLSRLVCGADPRFSTMMKVAVALDCNLADLSEGLWDSLDIR